jgi:hypothetical protein
MAEILRAPAGFRPAGRVLSAGFSNPPALRKKRYTGARLVGVKYEQKAQEYLEGLYPETYVPSPWIRFFAAGEGWRWCQPDGLIIDPWQGRIIIVEVKYQHTPDAWWQVKQLYMPVLHQIFPPQLWNYEFCEVVKWFDPAVQFPEKVILASEPSKRSSSFKVHIWKP